MVSLGPKLSAGAVTLLSGPTAFPSSIAVTLKGGGGGGGGVGAGATAGCGGGGGVGLLHPDRAATAASRPSARAPRTRDMGTSWVCWGTAREAGKESAGRYFQHLSRTDEVRILDGVLVRLVDEAPLLGVAHERLGDFGEAVSLHHRVSAFLRRVEGHRGGASLDV